MRKTVEKDGSWVARKRSARTRKILAAARNGFLAQLFKLGNNFLNLLRFVPILTHRMMWLDGFLEGLPFVEGDK